MIRIEPKPLGGDGEHAADCISRTSAAARCSAPSTATEKMVSVARAARERFQRAQQAARYELRPEDLLRGRSRSPRAASMDLIGIFHSHPDCDAYFSETDLKNSCPWYSFVVLSIQKGEFDHANSLLPDPDQTAAEKEELSYYMAKVLIPTPLRQYADKQDTVEAGRLHCRRSAERADLAATPTCASISITTKASCAASSTCI